VDWDPREVQNPVQRHTRFRPSLLDEQTE
jgi:hypothetical protein